MGPDGREVEIDVPDDVQPGDDFEVFVGAMEDEDSDLLSPSSADHHHHEEEEEEEGEEEEEEEEEE
eukprot:COSAG05_NODE_5976_length_1047_cov_2.531646_2_plen_65_part_01